VVGRAVARARAEGRPALVATFDPHPVRFFKPDVPPFRLTTLDQRERLFDAAGADAMLVFHFDAELAQVTAPDFVADYLVGRIGAAGVVTGEDFTFGKGRGGTIEVLKLLGQANRLSVDSVAPVSEDGEPVSSSRIREALVAGDCETAARLLTRPFAIEGAVVHGDRMGRKLGYPTANIPLDRYQRPRFGVYAVRARLGGDRPLAGVANLGIRPMFDPPRELLEPHFFDFDEEIYGETVEVDLLSFIRDEQSFDSLDALKAQIARDCAAARARLAR
jgi:riboflavin kinase/FMN adenylyltransferase